MSATKQTPEQREEFRRRIAQGMDKTFKEFEFPTPQSWYHFTNDTWTSSPPTPTSTTTTTTTTTTAPPRIRITTWNIDANAPASKERMAVALSHLSDLQTRDNSEDLPSIIFLQEMLDTDIELIKAAPWVRKRFFITDVEGNKSATFGTTMLADRRLDVRRVFRVLYDKSCMQRDGLFVDVEIGNDAVLRLCNTHLESMAYAACRAAQLQLASSYLHGPGTLPSSSDTTTKPKTTNLPTPHAAILAGDLNANSPEDQPLPAQNNLRDAFLVLGGQEDTEESYTWGQQAPDHLREEFGYSRMDKVLFCEGVEVESLRRVGEGVEAWVEYPKWSDDEDEEDEETGESVWVSDHLGLEVVFRLV